MSRAALDGRLTRWLTPLLLALAGLAGATDLGTPAQTFRSALADAQSALILDPADAASAVQRARTAFTRDLAPALARRAPGVAKTVDADLTAALEATKRRDEPALATARALAWTALLGGAERALEGAVTRGDAAEARDWLALREYRAVNRFTRLSTDATLAVQDLAAGRIGAQEALTGVRADLLDAYQARLTDSLSGLGDDLARGYQVRAAEKTALAQGYFTLLEPAYRRQQGDAALKVARAAFAGLPGTLKQAVELNARFRAAPLSAREQVRRAGQVMRYLKLVPVEYGRGVTEQGGIGVVKRDLEVTEARTFLTSAQAAYADVAPLLPDHQGTDAVRAAFADLAAGVGRAAAPASASQGAVLTPAVVQDATDVLLGQLDQLFPATWKRHDVGGDLDVIRTQLQALQSAVGAGDYNLAESARIDAYATLEGGPEARVAVFAPDLKLRLENLFWNGETPGGLSRLIRARAPQAEFTTTLTALDAALTDTGKLFGTEIAPVAVATNAGVIVFREGLEAVLILAALMGSLRRPAVLHLRRPMWVGALGALLASVLTWLVLARTLTLFAQYGEKLSAVVSVVAIGVLLVIMNWFFHNVYWTDRMAGFQQQKHQLTGRRGSQEWGQWWGLAVLGFTSIYREGFETVLFLQSLVLSSGASVVLAGTGAGLALVLGCGLLIFTLQAKLPMKKLLVYTGGMICAVLFVMVGNTVHVLQLVGWFPIHALPFSLPGWAGLWLGLYETWEGVLLQIFAVTAVIGSYFLAEGLKTRTLRRKVALSPSLIEGGSPVEGSPR